MPCLIEDHDLVQLFSEYSGLTRDEVIATATRFCDINAMQWAKCPGDSWEERAPVL